MRIKTILLVLLACMISFANISPAAGKVMQSTSGCFRIQQSNDRAVILELNAESLQVNRSQNGLQGLQTLSIAGMSQTTWPNLPQLPTCGGLIGLSSIQGVSVEVLDMQYETLQGIVLTNMPSNTAELYKAQNQTEPNAIPNAISDPLASLIPGKLVEIGQSGYLRDQPVAQVQFYPVQYNPANGEVRFYRHIVAAIKQGDKNNQESDLGRGASLQFEQILRTTLANYSYLDRPQLSSFRPEPVTTSPISPALDGQQIKIGVSADGFYQLTYAELSGAGFDFTGVDAYSIKISNRGIEIPILVQGEQDGQFNPGDRILFYGIANADIYSTVNIYLLSAGGDPGLRMATRSGTPGGAPFATQFLTKLHAEQDTYYWQTMPNGAGQDHWFWGDRISSNSDLPTFQEYGLTLGHPSALASDATVRVQLKGFTNDQYFSPDHRTRLYLNDELIEPGQYWDGYAVFDFEKTITASLLQEGENIIKVEAMPVTATVDQEFINWIELDYWDTYIAQDNELVFSAPSAGDFNYQVDGFSSEDIRLFDITDPYAIELITDTVISTGAGYKIEFQDTATAETHYMAITDANLLSAASLILDVPSAWKSPQNGADYILITHQDLMSSAMTLADYHANTGLRVATVNVEDIYDEFNYGIFNPQAIRDFLAYTYQNWQAPAPVYVLLLGEASYDYRNLLGLGRVNYVPTQMIETILLGQTASDNWLVAFNGDDILPEMIVGRLPASNPNEADIMVDKVISYDENPPDASWNKNALLIADDGDPSFEAINERISGILPGGYPKNKLYRADFGGDIKAAIISYINQGSFFTNYAGHGTPLTWGGFFNNTDVGQLNNLNKLTVVTIGNCLSGFFVGKSNPSMAEAFMQLPDKGAVAVWAPSGVGYPAGHQDMLEEFYKLIYYSRMAELGMVTTTAKINVFGQNGAWGDLVETFIYFGDPLTQVENIPIGTYLPFVQQGNP